MLCLPDLNPVILSGDAVLLQARSGVIASILEELITAEELVLAIDRLHTKLLHVELLADVVDFDEAVVDQMLLDLFIGCAVDVFRPQLRII